MLAFLLVVFVASVATMLSAHEGGQIHAFSNHLLATASVSGGLAGLVFLQWILHPRSAKDLVGGGFIQLDETPESIRWLNWGIFFTRSGEIDEPAKRLRIKRSVIFGIIPVGTIDRSLDDFYRVAVDANKPFDLNPRTRYTTPGGPMVDAVDVATAVVTGNLDYTPPFSFERDSVTIRCFYRVALVDRHALELNLAAFSETFTHRGDEIAGRFRERLTSIVAIDRRRIGINLPHDPRPAGSEPGPAQPKAGPHMVCPNCKKAYPVSQATCTACHVALFRDE